MRIRETQSALAEKLDVLEHSLTQAMHETKENVHRTADGVKAFCDIGRHVSRHPWLLLGSAMAMGYVGSRLFLAGRGRERSRRHHGRHNGSWFMHAASVYAREARPLVIGAALALARKSMARAQSLADPAPKLPRSAFLSFLEGSVPEGSEYVARGARPADSCRAL
jgi:hypothetical protein